MEKKKIKLWILHAGLGHPSPYFYNLINALKKYSNIEIVVSPDLPINDVTDNGVIYFNRLKRYYDSESIDSVSEFLNKIDILKNNGWKLIFTIHNFFPIDRKTTDNDEILLKEFLSKMDVVFTLTDYMKNSLKKIFKIKAINHSIGKNILDDAFDKNICIPKLPKEAFVFTFIGNISEYKMLDEIMINFTKIKKENVYLIIAGPDSNNFKLSKIIDKRIIRINEFIGDSNWLELSKITNVFVNSYDIKRECFKYGFFPSNCIQIMNHKKICIVPKSKVISEILPRGYYFTYKNSSDLYNVMLKAIKSEQKIKIKEKQYPDFNHSWEKTAEIIVSSIRRIIK